MSQFRATLIHIPTGVEVIINEVTTYGSYTDPPGDIGEALQALADAFFSQPEVWQINVMCAVSEVCTPFVPTEEESP